MPEYGVNLPPEGLDRLLDAEALAGRRLPLNYRLIQELSRQVQAKTPLLEGARRLSVKELFSRPSITGRDLQQAFGLGPTDPGKLAEYERSAQQMAAASPPLWHAAARSGPGLIGMLAALLSLGGSSDPKVLRHRGLLPPMGPAGRPAIRNPDGSYSSERTITIGTDQGFVNIPTMFGGAQVPPQEAIRRARESGWKDAETGRALEFFPAIESALQAAQRRSADLGSGLLPPKSPDVLPPFQMPLMLNRMESFTQTMPRARRQQEPQEDLSIPPWR